MHDPPFWEPSLVSQYAQFWLPNHQSEKLVGQVQQATDSCYHHIVYDYPCQSFNKLVCRKDRLDTYDNPIPTICKRKVSNKKPTSDGSERKQPPCRSKKKVPDDHVIRTYKMRFFPTQYQKRILKNWMNGARHTYNWALSVCKRQNSRRRVGGAEGKIEPSNRIDLKKHFVTCKESRIPKKLRWLRTIPYSVKEQATFELSLAYASAYKHFAEGKEFDYIKFRSKKRSNDSITIPKANFDKNNPWQFYSKTFKCSEAKLKFHKRDVSRILERYPNGPDGNVNISMTKTGRFFMSARIYVQKEQLKDSQRGHLVGLDPGSNPFMTYYTPTRMECGSFGTTDDVERIMRQSQEKFELLSSWIDKKGDNDAYYTPNQRRKWRKKRLRVSERRKNMVMETIHKTIRYLTTNYEYIHASIFEVADMIVKLKVGQKRTINGTTRRELQGWNHFAFKTKLQQKTELIDGLYVEFNDEAYTTKACTRCGHLNIVTGKLFKCKKCQFRIHRDVGGARNGILKTCTRNYIWI